MVRKYRVISIGCIVSLISLYSLLTTLYFTTPAYATVDPLKEPNNRFGIHIIDGTDEEASEAATLVNSSGGDWGYVTLVIKDSDRNVNKWQTFFNLLRERHLIPIVRLATSPENDHWKLPYPNEEESWADFLNNLNWPTKNRYVIVYNEPNHAQEWGNKVDAGSYAQILNKTIDALKKRSSNFFVINAGLDTYAPQKMPAYEDEEAFLKDMNVSVPGIFNKLDGFDSHSYPGPGFAGPPDGYGRGSVRGYQWELGVLKSLGVQKDLPVFITETGWKHAEGETFDNSLPNSQTVGEYLKEAYSSAWNDPRIVAVTPFLINYQSSPFDHFSFKKLDSNSQILGTQYYPQYLSMQTISKTAGTPIQDSSGTVVGPGIYKTLTLGQTYTIPITIKNTGQSIWGEKGSLRLIPSLGQSELGLGTFLSTSAQKVLPGQSITFKITVHAPETGSFKTGFRLMDGPEEISLSGLDSSVDVEPPVVLVIRSSLKWKNDSEGNYTLTINSPTGNDSKVIALNKGGSSTQIEAPELLPNYGFDFTLRKQFYQEKTVHLTVKPGVNTIDFKELQPDISLALLNPMALWSILPFSN